MEYYERLKLLREGKKLSQKELGDLLGFSQSTVSQYERNVRKPSPEGVIKFAMFFKVSVNYLFGFTDDPTPPKSDK